MYNLNSRHSRAVAWQRYQRRTGKYIGIELEMSHRGGMRRLLEILPEPRQHRLRPSVEHDGSLDMRTSAEIVFPPFSYRSIRDKTSTLARAMEALADGGAKPDESCGMHMNVNCSYWSREKKAMFGALINWMPREWLTNIGGRDLSIYCRQLRYYRIEDYVNDGLSRGACAYRGNRLEVRFPDATTDHDRVVMLSHFLELLEKLAADETTVQTMLRLWDQVPTNERYQGSNAALVVEKEVRNMVANFFSHTGTKWSRKVWRVMQYGYQAEETTVAVVAQAA